MSGDISVIFVFNADSGKLNTMKDSIKKIFKPNTYECKLCNVGYGTFGMKSGWKDFTNNSTNDIPINFLHRDEFKEKYPEIMGEFPCAYSLRDGHLELLISKDEIDSINNEQELIDLSKNKINSLR